MSPRMSSMCPGGFPIPMSPAFGGTCGGEVAGSDPVVTEVEPGSLCRYSAGATCDRERDQCGEVARLLGNLKGRTVNPRGASQCLVFTDAAHEADEATWAIAVIDPLSNLRTALWGVASPRASWPRGVRVGRSRSSPKSKLLQP